MQPLFLGTRKTQRLAHSKAAAAAVAGRLLVSVNWRIGEWHGDIA
jgi:hypothetical protein